MGLSKLLKSSAQKKQLFSATVELTPQCNLNCSFCYVCDRHLKTASGNERSTREWLDLLREAAALGLFLVSFTGGEVLMRPDFEEIYCKSCEIGLRPTILTNGTLLDEKKITYLKKYPPLCVSISLYGMSEQIYEEVTGSGAAFPQVMNAIDLLMDAHMPVQLKALALRPLLPEYGEMAKYVREMGMPFLLGSYFYPERSGLSRQGQAWSLTPGEVLSVRRYFTAMGLIKPPRLHWNDLDAGIHCNAGQCSFAITHQGFMQPCLMLTEKQSRPFDIGVAAAWQEIQDYVAGIQPCPDCACCADRAYCRKCPAKRLGDSGCIDACGEAMRSHARVSRRLYEECMEVANED